jgi:hypothetical protein
VATLDLSTTGQQRPGEYPESADGSFQSPPRSCNPTSAAGTSRKWRLSRLTAAHGFKADSDKPSIGMFMSSRPSTVVRETHHGAPNAVLDSTKGNRPAEREEQRGAYEVPCPEADLDDEQFPMLMVTTGV